MASRAIQIELPTDTPLFTLKVTLTGQDFTLRFDYIERQDSWRLSLLDASGAYIGRGMKVVPNWNVLRTIQSEARPKGVLLFIDERGDGSTIRFADLGRRVALHYLDDDGDG